MKYIPGGVFMDLDTHFSAKIKDKCHQPAEFGKLEEESEASL